jgi:hypothetical protein
MPVASSPTTFGLADAEVAREWERLTAAGWSPLEIARVLVATLIDVRGSR